MNNKPPSFTNKRNKFAQQIRKKQKNMYFQFQRHTNYGNLSLIAYVPALIQHQAYQDLQQILDGLLIQQLPQLPQNQPPLPQKTLQNIHLRLQHHSNTHIRILMLKLLNRLNLWTNKQYELAISILTNKYTYSSNNSNRNDNNQNDTTNQNINQNINSNDDSHNQSQSMIKQLAIYLQRLKNNNNSNNSNNRQLWQSKLYQIYHHIKCIKINRYQQYQLYWMDIVNDTIMNILAINHDNNNNMTITDIIDDIHQNDTYYHNMDIRQKQQQQQQLNNISKNNNNNNNRQFIFSRFINISNCIFGDSNNNKQYTNDKLSDIAHKITKMKCFPQLLTLIINGSIDIVMEGLELLAQIYNLSDQAINQSILYKNNTNNHNHNSNINNSNMKPEILILVIHKRYINHILEQIRLKNYWGISNLMGSIYNHFILQQVYQKQQQQNKQQQSLLSKLATRFYQQPTKKMKLQVYYCQLNLWCTFHENDYDKYIGYNDIQVTKFGDMMQKIGEQLTDNQMRGLLIQRYLFVMYNLMGYLKQNKSNQKWSSIGNNLQNIKRVLTQIYYEHKNIQKQQEQILQKIDTVLQMFEADTNLQ